MNYSHLARGYDAFTEDVDYAAWADYFEKLFALSGKKVNTIVELAFLNCPYIFSDNTKFIRNKNFFLAS
jgi:hypothetical protein